MSNIQHPVRYWGGAVNRRWSWGVS